MPLHISNIFYSRSIRTNFQVSSAIIVQVTEGDKIRFDFAKTYLILSKKSTFLKFLENHRLC